MSFGRNPHVAKAQAAEQKAQAARDEGARVLAWREAARLWDRAAEREAQDKKKREYEASAEAARAQADGESAPEGEEGEASAEIEPEADAAADRWLN
jgi:hypothetical protein